MRTIRSSLLALPAIALSAPAIAHPGHGGGAEGGLQALAYHLHPHGIEIALGALAVAVGGLAYRAWRKNGDR